MAAKRVWTEERKKALEQICRSSKSFSDMKGKTQADENFKNMKWQSILREIKEHPEWTEHLVAEVLKERALPEAAVLETSKEAYGQPGVRIGFVSRIDYKSEGFRAGLVHKAAEIFAKEGTQFNVIIGGLVDKQDLNAKLKEFLTRFPFKVDVRMAIDHFLNEKARELATYLPKIRKPSGTEYVRWYVITVPTYDGPFGEALVRRLRSLRPDDVRHYESGGDRLEIKESNNNHNNHNNHPKLIWAIGPKKSRLPSRYYSTAAEREIDDERGRSSHTPPDLWAVGTLASCVYKPNGERPEPYITIPALHKLKRVTVAENQVGVVIVEYTPEGQRFMKCWNLKDLVEREKEFITGVKSGSNDVHRTIVDTIKRDGMLTIGQLEDKTGINRKILEQEIKFLVEPEKSVRRTWPGLFYDSASQRYAFHLDWRQEDLRYPCSKEPYQEDRLLFFGCLHAGYATTDYQFFVERMPEIILSKNVQRLVGLGDFNAGLQHDFLHTGEVFGDLNNTDQETFAAELIGTVMTKVFTARFEKLLKETSQQNINLERIKALVEDSIVAFTYIPGNHDLWQERDGTTPLALFKYKLILLLATEISRAVSSRGLPSLSVTDLMEILNRKIVGFTDFEAEVMLPSGLKMAMLHPHMARADTTSLRAQKAIDFSKAQIVGMANFHISVLLHKWLPDLGQSVTVQSGHMGIFTRFEQRKMKTVDFGPVFLRVLSRKGKIEITESAFFNTPILQKPLKKWTDLDNLKKELGILTAP